MVLRIFKSSLGFFRSSWGHLGVIFESSLGHPGVILGSLTSGSEWLGGCNMDFNVNLMSLDLDLLSLTIIKNWTFFSPEVREAAEKVGFKICDFNRDDCVAQDELDRCFHELGERLTHLDIPDSLAFSIREAFKTKSAYFANIKYIERDGWER